MAFVAGVLCDKKILDGLKSKVYRINDRSTFDFKRTVLGWCWPATNEVESHLNVMEMMVRQMAGITRLDRTRNEEVYEKSAVAATGDKLRKTRIRWYVHVVRGGNQSVCRIGLDIEVLGKRQNGQPKQRWLDTLHADLKHVGVHPDQAHD